MSRYGRKKLQEAIASLVCLLQDEMGLDQTIEAAKAREARKTINAYLIDGLAPGTVLYV